MNTAEYRGMLLGFDLLDGQTRGRITICGDSNLVIRQMRGEIYFKAPVSRLLRHKAMQRLQSWPKHELLHIKRECNLSADRLPSSSLQGETGDIFTSRLEIQDLISLNRLHELIIPERLYRVVKMAAITLSTLRRPRRPKVLREEEYIRFGSSGSNRRTKKKVGLPM